MRDCGRRYCTVVGALIRDRAGQSVAGDWGGEGKRGGCLLAYLLACLFVCVLVACLRVGCCGGGLRLLGTFAVM